MPGPAIVASNATVVLALLTLLFASSPSTRSLGVQAASGLLVAAVFVLLVLPPLLALFGRKLFWPFVPQPDSGEITTTGAWHRVADWVSQHATRVAVVSIAVLAVLATGLLATPVGLNQIDQFRVSADSVTGFKTLSAHFPGGLTDPTRVIGSTDKTEALTQAIRADARRRVGEPGGPVRRRTHSVAGGHRRRTGFAVGLRYHCRPS